jgi:glycosyltransferase involved in cell wall biosynthesis
VRLLLITFAMDPDSPVLAWQQNVARRLAQRCERVVVMTERLAPCDLPANVEVHRVPRILTTPLRIFGVRWLMNIAVWRWCARERFDAVFVHMNADWAYRLAPCWRRFRIPVLLWYAHRSVTRRLRRAHAQAACVVTSTPEGFRIPSPKVRVIGQGIDADLFTPPASPSDSATIVAVGRVSRIKSVDLMVEAMAWLKAHAPQVPFTLRIVGPMLTKDDHAYRAELDALVQQRGLGAVVTFDGPRPMRALPDIYASAFLHLSLIGTGAIDKAILESLACGCPTLSSNESVFPLFEAFPSLVARDRTPEGIGRQILHAYQRRHEFAPADLRALVVGRHDLESYIDRVYGILSELAQANRGSRVAIGEARPITNQSPITNHQSRM